MQIDWGHFDSLTYGITKRKLYCMAAIECHSRFCIWSSHIPRGRRPFIAAFLMLSASLAVRPGTGP